VVVLFYFGEAARPDLFMSMRIRANMAFQYIPLLSFHTASCLPVVVELRVVAVHPPAAKTFSFRARYATGTHTDGDLAPIISPKLPNKLPQ
jgi:hypothetical protein